MSNQILSKTLLSVDESLHKLVADVDILSAVAPLNFKDAKRAFLQSNYSTNPVFIYRDHSVNSLQKKRALFNLPVDELADADLHQLYSDVIASYVDRIDQYASIGTSKFLYDSMRYFGEPSAQDIRNAHFILHLPNKVDDLQEPRLNALQIVEFMEAFAKQEGYQYQIQLDENMLANALVSGTTLKVNSAATIDQSEVHALAHHELGLHLVTTLNARAQPLKILSLGSPVNTMTQEGLAILCEYLAGHMSIARIRILALRVLAVESMIKDKSFKHTFLMLKEEHQIPDDLAFTITARVHRGGGFTKDYLYLRGLSLAVKAFEETKNFVNLLSGKVSLDHLDLVTRLIEKGALREPVWLSPAIRNPSNHDPIQKFIISAIK